MCLWSIIVEIECASLQSYFALVVWRHLPLHCAVSPSLGVPFRLMIDEIYLACDSSYNEAQLSLASEGEQEKCSVLR